ncbi:hypothetical protein CerSpe_164290 [Prunus speciosa]
MWRGCRNALVVKENLRSRCVDVDNTCSLCGQERESQVHIFFRCEYARLFWFASSMQLDVPQIEGTDFRACWDNLLRKYGRVEHCNEILQCVVFGLWRLWKSRNSVVFYGCIWDPGDCVDDFHSQMQEYKAAQTSTKPLINKLPRPPEQQDRSNCTWTKPAQGWVKANCDGAWLKQMQRGGVGWVIRDDCCWMVLASSMGGLQGSMALVMEAEAIKEALLTFVETQLMHGKVESDSRLLMQMLKGEIN